jgi:uncharacterized membrane protein YfcA
MEMNISLFWRYRNLETLKSGELMEITLISVVVIIAAGIGTMTGFGTSTIMVPIMLLFYPLTQTLFFVGIIHFFGNIWKLLLFRKGIQ